MQNFSLTTPTLAQNCWPALPQTLVDEIFSKTQGQLASLTGIVASASTPAPADQDKMWVKLDGSGKPTGQYIYAGGLWLWPHPMTASGGFRLPWIGLAANIPLIDGGANVAVTTTTGPFWEIDTNFDGRSPMGVGNIPTATPAKALASDEAYGEGSHTMTDQEIAPHAHPLASVADMTASGAIKVVDAGTTGPGLQRGLTGDYNTSLTVQNNTFTTTQQAMPVIHPVRGCYFLKRTARVWMTG